MITNVFNNFGYILEKYFSNDSEINLLICPFISISAVTRLLGNTRNVLIITSWRKDHLISGVSNLELYPLCNKMGWKLAINDRIHAKIYSSNLDSCYITSANCTEKALYCTEGNIECISYVDELDRNSRVELNKIILESIIVTDEIYDQFKFWLDKINQNQIECEGPPAVDSSFYINKLPATDNPYLIIDRQRGCCFEDVDLVQRIDHDIALFDSHNSKEICISDLSKNFFNNRFIQEIEGEITECGISFGKLSSLIHNLCVDVPSPYRRDVKTLTHNVMSWFCILNPDNYYIDVPGRHSFAHAWYTKYPTRKSALNAILFTDFLLSLKAKEQPLEGKQND